MKPQRNYISRAEDPEKFDDFHAYLGRNETWPYAVWDDTDDPKTLRMFREEADAKGYFVELTIVTGRRPVFSKWTTHRWEKGVFSDV